MPSTPHLSVSQLPHLSHLVWDKKIKIKLTNESVKQHVDAIERTYMYFRCSESSMVAARGSMEARKFSTHSLDAFKSVIYSDFWWVLRTPSMARLPVKPTSTTVSSFCFLGKWLLCMAIFVSLLHHLLHHRLQHTNGFYFGLRKREEEKEGKR